MEKIKMKGSTIKVPNEHASKLLAIATKRQMEKGEYYSVSRLVKEVIENFLKEQKEV